MDRDLLEQELSIDEGKRNKMYSDSMGIPTIGIGHNLRDGAISDRAVSQIFLDDLDAVLAELNTKLPWYLQLSDARQRVLANMAFNVGVPRLLGFHNMLSALQIGDYERAAREMLDSAWARELPARSARLVVLMRQG